MRILPVALALLCAVPVLAAGPLTLHLEDFATPPMTGSLTGDTPNNSVLARINFFREEPGGRGRVFVNDLNGQLYMLDKKTRQFTPYLDFDGSGDRRGLFDKLTTHIGWANGLITFQFDPEYTTNGRFYTVHLEDPTLPGSNAPDASTLPGLVVSADGPSPAMLTPGTHFREAVLFEWTDNDRSDARFSGTAREVLRLSFTSRAHPMGDLAFNPVARPGDPDWKVLYIGCGDGAAGEQRSAVRQHPQRLDLLVGKILRIVPDPGARTDSSTPSASGRYRIPNDNPFTTTAGARGEIWAYGLRNPHRLIWDVDPARPSTPTLLTTSIGLHDWETVYVVKKGANYGYSEREGNEQLLADNTTGPLPASDRVPVRVTDTVTDGDVVPTYPVLQYAHTPTGGDGIAGGFVYRGAKFPALRGKFVFADITTGRIWYADMQEMLAADDGNPATVAAMHDMRISWRASESSSAPRIYPTMFPLVQEAYRARGGQDPDVPGGRSTISGAGRADIRLVVDAAGEPYVMSKSDGVIRVVVDVTP